MNTPSQTHFFLLKKFVNKTLTYIWLAYVLIPYSLTFHWTKLLIFVLIVCVTIMRIPLRSLRMFFVILYLAINSINKFMVWLWVLANIFMCSFENKWLKDCPHGLNPVFCRRYVDDIFVLFSSLDHAENFINYLSSKHPIINFLLENCLMVVYLF